MPPDPALAAIEAERARQDAKWGGPAHDDQHDAFDWLEIAADQIDRAYTAEDDDTPAGRAALARKCLVRIGAVALAGIQSLDRAFPPTA